MAYCEASLHIYCKEDDETERKKQIHPIQSYCSNTVKVTGVTVVQSVYEEESTHYVLTLSVTAEVLVQYDRLITHLNDYRVNACREFRRQFPAAGAVMAHSLDTYSPFRLDGFIHRA